MSDKFPPMYFQWDGDGMVPGKPYQAMANRHFVVGEWYRLEAREERSARTHRHYFASINEAWKTLPDSIAHRFPSPEHLRKWALCQAGFCDVAEIGFKNRQQAQQVARVLRKMDPYCVILVADDAIRVLTAHSQSQSAADKHLFQKQKVAVLHVIDGLLEVNRGTTAKQKESA